MGSTTTTLRPIKTDWRKSAEVFRNVNLPWDMVTSANDLWAWTFWTLASCSRSLRGCLRLFLQCDERSERSRSVQFVPPSENQESVVGRALIGGPAALNPTVVEADIRIACCAYVCPRSVAPLTGYDIPRNPSRLCPVVPGSGVTRITVHTSIHQLLSLSYPNVSKLLNAPLAGNVPPSPPTSPPMSDARSKSSATQDEKTHGALVASRDVDIGAQLTVGKGIHLDPEEALRLR